jgi:trans-aconitate methyltransferase
MSDPVLALYQNAPYPGVSHPSTDPAATVVAARLAGLEVPSPSRARILDIGCAAGHNLLPLAARWPDSHFTGIDFTDAAIARARDTAKLAGLENVEFHSADLRTFDPGDGVEYDFIIAHGFYSWVPAEVRQALLDFCRSRLSPSGLALISYNTLPGWSLRKSVVDLVRATGGEAEEVLGRLATAAGSHTNYARHLTAVLHDMFGKWENSLMFDDFAEVNEPCTVVDFISHAASSGLRYLAESQLAENLPPSLPRDAAELLHSLSGDPLVMQQTVDVLTNRTFRSSLLCRDDAPAHPATSAEILGFSVRCPHSIVKASGGIRLLNRAGDEIARQDHPLALTFFSALEETAPQSVPIREIVSSVSVPETTDLARWILDAARKGLVLLRAEPVRLDANPPAYPNLGALRLSSARDGHPLADVYHASYRPDDARRKLAIHMDGKRSMGELAGLARTIAPQLDFPAWMSYLAGRGMFS